MGVCLFSDVCVLELFFLCRCVDKKSKMWIAERDSSFVGSNHSTYRSSTDASDLRMTLVSTEVPYDGAPFRVGDVIPVSLKDHSAVYYIECDRRYEGGDNITFLAPPVTSIPIASKMVRVVRDEDSRSKDDATEDATRAQEAESALQQVGTSDWVMPVLENVKTINVSGYTVDVVGQGKSSQMHFNTVVGPILE